jgi:regulator of cell morphogenesis and NO signaling
MRVTSFLSASNSTVASRAMESASLGDLIAHIEQTHHAFTRDHLARMASLLRSLDAVGTPVSAELRDCCNEMEADLIPHLMKEERILFPYIVQLESSTSRPPRSCFGSVANPIGMMNFEHDTLAVLLARVRVLTENYHPDSACSVEMATLYRVLESLDADLVQHMHLESDFLFPRALQLENEALA